MSVASTTVWEVQVGGSATNGGGYDPVYGGANGGSDMSQGAATALTGLTTSGANATTVSGTGFTVGMNGNVVYISGGTNFVTGWYQLSGIVAGTSAVFDRSPTTAGAGSAGTGNVGGPLDSWGTAGAVITALATLGVVGNIFFFKYNASVHQITLTTLNASGGVIKLPTLTAALANMIRFVGYNTTRTKENTDALAPTIQAQAGVTSCNLFDFNSQFGVSLHNLILDGAANASVRLVNVGTGRGRFKLCEFTRATNGAIAGSNSNIHATDCYFTANTTANTITAGGTYLRCVFSANTFTVLNPGANASYLECLFLNNTGAATDVIVLSQVGSAFDIINCTFHGNGRHGINYTAATTASSPTRIINSILTNNGGYGVESTNTNDFITVENCAFYNNTSGQVDTTKITGTNVISSITLTGLPYNNAAGNDFSLNNVAGQGAACRAAGEPIGNFTSLTTRSYRDIGASQHADPAQAGGGNVFIGSIGIGVGL